MAKKPETPRNLPLNTDELDIVNNLENAPTIYIDGVQGMTAINDAVKLNLYQIIQDFPGDGEASTPKKVMVARLAMSPGTLLSVVGWLAARAKDMERAIEQAKKDSDASE